MAHATFAKPIRGTALLARRDRTATRKRAEQAIMQAAKKRDGYVCRWPGCAMKTRRLPMDVCHLIHRGMGGNPSGSRTATTATLICLCRHHHGLLDANLIQVDRETKKIADGPLSFYERTESGRFELVAIETRIGVSCQRIAARVAGGAA